MSGDLPRRLTKPEQMGSAGRRVAADQMSVERFELARLDEATAIVVKTREHFHEILKIGFVSLVAKRAHHVDDLVPV